MKKLGVLFSLALACLMLACGPAQQAGPSQGAADPNAPKFGGTLNTVGDDFTDFDMAFGGKTIENIRVHGLVLQTLLRFKKGPDVAYVSQVLQPYLAEKWEISADAKTFTYNLRKGVKYADVAPANGREFTSADVKWTMEYLSRTGQFADKKYPPSLVDALFEGLDGIDTPDKYTVKVRFKDPYAPFVFYTASEWMPMYLPESFKADSNPPRLGALVGTGPFILDIEASQKGTRTVLKKNPNFYDAPKPYLDRIHRLIIPDEATQMAAFQVKQIDVIVAKDYKSAQEIERQNPGAIKDEAFNPYPGDIFISQRPGRHPALTDKRVRKAINIAVDRDELSKVLSGGKGPWALPASWPGLFSDEEVHQMQKYDPVEAKRLLAEAGYANGLTLEAMLLGPTPGTSELLIQAQLKKVGIDAPFTILERTQSRARLYVGDYDIVPRSSGASAADADFDGFQFTFHSASGQNWAVVKDPDLDKLILNQRRETDPQKRRDAQRAVVKRIYEMSWNNAQTYSPVIEFRHTYLKNYRNHFSVGEADAFSWLDK